MMNSEADVKPIKKQERKVIHTNKNKENECLSMGYGGF